jgi:hypothetical protein
VHTEGLVATSCFRIRKLDQALDGDCAGRATASSSHSACPQHHAVVLSEIVSSFVSCCWTPRGARAVTTTVAGASLSALCPARQPSNRRCTCMISPLARVRTCLGCSALAVALRSRVANRYANTPTKPELLTRREYHRRHSPSMISVLAFKLEAYFSYALKICCQWSAAAPFIGHARSSTYDRSTLARNGTITLLGYVSGV